MKTSNNRGRLLVLTYSAIPVNLILSIQKLPDYVRIYYGESGSDNFLPECVLTFNDVILRYEQALDRSNNG